MTSRTWRNMASSKIQGPYEKRKPSTFRVIMKSRSGYLINQQDDKKSQISVRDKRNKTQMSFMKQDIKDYVKSMRKTNVQEMNPNPQPNIRTIPFNHQQQKNKQKQQLSQSKTSQFRGGSATKSSGLQIPTKQLQRRIDQLIKLKLQYIQQLQQIQRGSWRNHSHTQTKEQRKLQNIKKIQSADKEIGLFVDMMKERIGDQDEGQKLEDINRKIGIIQKVMAEGMAQSQIAKKGYYKFINKYKPKATNLKMYNHNMQKLRQDANSMLSKSQIASINLQSTNQLSYKVPDKKSYATKAQRTTYTFKNQPLHRSTYSREYLIYGSVPTYPYKQGASQILPSFSPTKLKSLYSSEFTGKQGDRINFKQLDCYRDKFKNIDVSFMAMTNHNDTKTHHKDKSNKNSDNIGKGTVSSVRKPEHSRTVRYNTEHYIRNLSTESQNKFTGEDNEIRSVIKHKNLYKLKYAYKATAHG